MSFYLVYGDHELTLPLYFESHIEEQLYALISRTASTKQSSRELGKRIVEAMTAVIDGNVTPPTEKQIKYAVAIARELSLQLTPEVLQFRDAMAAFLTMHAQRYRQRKSLISGDRKSGGNTSESEFQESEK